MIFAGILTGFLMILATTLTTFSGIQTKSMDTERETDIKALHSRLEAYFAENGRYPTFQNMNDPKWRQTNMKGLHDEALKDPDGTSAMLAAKPAKSVYAYEVTTEAGGTCNNVNRDCDTYRLTAMRINSGPFVKRSLN